MNETIIQICEGILQVALYDVSVATILHAGRPARYVVKAPDGVVYAHVVEDGGLVRIPREFRLVVQPLDHVRTLPVCCEARTWSTQ